MTTYFFTNPYLGRYVHIDSMGGFDVKITEVQTPTITGMRQILALKKYPDFLCETESCLINALRKIEKAAAFIIDAQLVAPPDCDLGSSGKHAISLFVVKKSKIVQVFDNNSAGSDVGPHNIPDFLFKVFGGFEVQYFASEVKRQSLFTCQTYALDDCEKFSEKLAEEILQLNNLQGVCRSGCYAIKKLPPTLLLSHAEADRKLREYTKMLRDRHLREVVITAIVVGTIAAVVLAF